jgi:hypothetical protein
MAVALLAGAAGCASEPSAPAGGSAGGAADAPAVSAVGLVGGNSLVKLTTADPASGQPTPITGLDGDTTLVGIDYRVQDGKLYGVGNAGGLYTVEDSGAATKTGALSVPLEGQRFGVDFNPAANALRVISDTGQNLRQPFATTPLPATVADTKLTNPAVAPATGTVPATGVVAAGYTNNDTDAATGTALYVLDATAGRVSIQSPANGGILAPSGGLGLTVGPASGFDVHSANGVNTGYAALQVGDAAELHKVDLLTGKATRVGALSAPVTDLAVALS